MKKIVALVLTVCFFALGCAHSKNEVADSKYMEKKKTMAFDQKWEPHFAQVAKVDYNKGSKILSEADKVEIRELIQTASANGVIHGVKVLAWADRDYSKIDRKPSRADIELADARARAIESYIQKQIGFHDVDTHNMAKNPGALARMFKTEDYRLKAGTYDQDGKSFKPIPSPQKAVVLIEMDETSYKAE